MFISLIVLSASIQRRVFQDEPSGGDDDDLSKIFGKCTPLDLELLNYTTLTAKPGESYCIEYKNFIITSDQEYSVDIREKENPGPANIVKKPFIVATKNLTYKNIKCDDKNECKFNIAFIYGSEQINSQNGNLYVALNKEAQYSGTVNVNKPAGKSKEAKFDATIINYLANKEYNVKIKAESGNLLLFYNESAKNLTEGNTIEFKQSSGSVIIACSFSVRSEEALVASAKYSVTLKFAEEGTTNTEAPFGGKELDVEVKKEASTEKEVFESQRDSTPTPKPSNSLTPGAIAGIAIAAVAVVVIICLLVWYFVFHKKPAEKGSGSGQDV